MRKSFRIVVSTFASRTSPSTDQSLQKSFHLSHLDKIELKKISSPSENKKYAATQPDTTKTMKRSIDNGLQTQWTEGQLITAPTKNWRFSASYDSFVVQQTFVLRINICGKNRQLLVAANRCASFKKNRKRKKLSWINKIFRTKKVEEIPTRKINYIQITKDWNVDPVSPEIELKVDGIDLIMDIYLNHFQFNKYQEGDKVKIRFKNCAEYSLNTCNDEGYFYGQYRTNHNELPWGEFYEIKSGLDKELPKPIDKIQTSNSDRKHFIFFFKDETFEFLASDYYLDFYNEKVLNSCKKKYNVVLEGKKIGTSKLEKADAPMGVAFGIIQFNGIETPYEFFKEYCLKNNINKH